jgi:glucokinase
MKKTSRSRVVLAGDVGGTKTRLGLFRVDGSDIRSLRSQTFPSKEFSDLESIIERFLEGEEHLCAATLGVAGPVVAGAAVATNLPWKISERSLKKFLSLPTVSLVNDLVANAHGIEVMQPKDFMTLNRGRRAEGNRALLSAGTGLGSAILFWDGSRHIPSPSEGGHVDFGPKNRVELGLLRYLFEQFGRVSYERILSGSGLFSIYRFLRDTGKYGKEPSWLSLQMEQKDPAAAITEAAHLGKSKLCEATLELFVSIYGAAAGNLALQVMATGGVFIGGGIAPKISGKLKDGTFMKAFLSKGRLSPIVERIPVKVIMNDQAALLGAAAHAAKICKETKRRLI